MEIGHMAANEFIGLWVYRFKSLAQGRVSNSEQPKANGS
jgi:hypothetical protein